MDKIEKIFLDLNSVLVKFWKDQGRPDKEVKIALLERMLNWYKKMGYITLDTLSEEPGVDVTDFCKPIDPGIPQCVADHWHEMFGVVDKHPKNTLPPSKECDHGLREPLESEEPDKSLEEAANKFAVFYDQGTCNGIAQDCFIAGAEWQARQLLQGSPMPEDTVLFNKGVAEGRRLEREDMMKIITKDDNLEEAAKNIYKVPFGTRAEDFIAGADWQEKQDLKYISEIHKNGYNLCKEQMLKDAVEGVVGKDGILTLSNGEAVDLCPSLDKIAFGLQPRQKVRIVVLKEEEE